MLTWEKLGIIWARIWRLSDYSTETEALSDTSALFRAKGATSWLRLNFLAPLLHRSLFGNTSA